jgi:hypothetical protein
MENDNEKQTEIQEQNETKPQRIVSPEARIPAKLTRTPRGAKRAMLTLARDIMEREQTCPLTTLLRMSKNRRLPITVRLQAAASAAPFCFPKLASIAVNLKNDAENAKLRESVFELMNDPARLKQAQDLSLALSNRLRDHNSPAALPAPPNRLDAIDAEFEDVEPDPERNA